MIVSSFKWKKQNPGATLDDIVETETKKKVVVRLTPFLLRDKVTLGFSSQLYSLTYLLICGHELHTNYVFSCFKGKIDYENKYSLTECSFSSSAFFACLRLVFYSVCQ